MNRKVFLTWSGDEEYKSMKGGKISGVGKGLHHHIFTFVTVEQITYPHQNILMQQNTNLSHLRSQPASTQPQNILYSIHFDKQTIKNATEQI
jgi:hypothetical protein